ncbi:MULTISPECIES: DUF6286 domain-containing protein [Pseudonocardia]|uniref:DUF6286 domain-containing protein n=2 Tax=Pseudonocardia TaxID=1847 RepID=A0A1Y2MYL6_PSEAH|nr:MULTISPECIES: DUF6286 domain-containing protein [Pseudonocardia]OSY39917.1 hypothetical protein BG845_03152 [Pseudonocardia autotrophica]TDN74513.1 hypothetical protein C8E95_3636 [Pseudonocardia autotrophica]BBG05281.1 hypothetical protein Pdca_64900 [Pseudonocardia autotrophica]GEC28849.1 hypothetical protein PSA01_58780 [Pseudonocardia saturnea]
MIRRPRRSVAASLVALVLLAACVLLAVAVVQQLIGQQPVLPFADLNAFGAGLTGADVAFLALSGVLALVGLLLLLVALRPGTPTVLPLAGRDGAGTTVTDTGITRRSLDRALSDAATGVDGIARANVSSTRRTASVSAHASFGDATALRTAVRDAVSERLAAIGPSRSPRVRVKVTGTKES